MEVFRIVHEKHSHRLMSSGIAARWNSDGHFVIYTSTSRALACLENMVHRGGEGISGLFRTLVIEVPSNLKMKKISSKDLPSEWSALENISFTRRIGDDWLKKMSSPLLKVPSAIIPDENNLILNPAHDDFKKIKIKSIEAFTFDIRLLQKRKL